MTAQQLPTVPARIHFIGIGGISMSGLARVLHAWGYTVSGSDSTESAALDRLRELGIEVVIGHTDGRLAGTADVVVTTLRAAVNAPVEIEAATANGATFIKRGQLLGMLAEEKKSVAVAGTHGKSTTSGMVTIGLRALGQDPTYTLGAVLAQTGHTVAPGDGPHLVAEADEFDRAFHYLKPDVAIITSVAFDHPDIYRDQDDYDQAFAEFALGIKPSGRLIVPTDDEGTQRVVDQVRDRLDAEIVTFGLDEAADWRLTLANDGWWVNGRYGVRYPVRPIVPGDHNVRNTVAAALAIEALGYGIGSAIDAASAFTGIKRRFELKGAVGDVVVIDDYAHHPDEIRVMVDTARSVYPDRRIVAVHQPHTFSRTKALLDAFAAALDKADLAVVMEIFPSSETDSLGISSADLVARMKPGTLLTGEPADTVERLAAVVKPGDLVMTMGAGTITEVGDALIAKLEARARTQMSPLKIQEQVKLSLYTTMRVGGPVDYLIRAATPDEVIAACNWGLERSFPITVIGGGSNLLVSDLGIRGLTIIVKVAGDKALAQLEVVDDGDYVLVTAPAQAPISGIGRYCAEQGWAGMDWAVGLPGQIGGATVNNAGAHGTELKDYLVSVDLLADNGEVVTQPAEWLAASYRMTRVKGTPRPRPWIVLRSTFRLPKGNREELVALADEHAEFRKRTQPSGACSGSIFANPEGDFAGRLLETAGLKGYAIGAMQFSEKHANWIVNTGGGTAGDAWALILHGRQVVQERFGVTLRPEVERIGEGDGWETFLDEHA
jgi:UDP-N-acetylmuramate--L-alanine ligase/UDP-N-acetylenolpyruvoylglucosamine reductase